MKKVVYTLALVLVTGAMMSFTTGEVKGSKVVSEVAKSSVTIKLKNTGSDVAELFYQETPGSRNLTSFRIQKGQTRELEIEVGTEVYYRDGNSAGKLIVKITADLNGKTINV